MQRKKTFFKYYVLFLRMLYIIFLNSKGEIFAPILLIYYLLMIHFEYFYEPIITENWQSDLIYMFVCIIKFSR